MGVPVNSDFAVVGARLTQRRERAGPVLTGRLLGGGLGQEAVTRGSQAAPPAAGRTQAYLGPGAGSLFAEVTWRPV